MREDLETMLVERFPVLFQEYGKDPRQSLMAFGVECGDGWYDILYKLFEKLEKCEGLYLAQVKEKFGGLRVYVGFTQDANECISDSETAYEAIDEAEIASTSTCERCGKPGTINNENFWLSTRCPECLKKEK